jgi:hydrogenase maturation protein HypF
VLAEHGCNGPAVGVIMDGTGYGPDGTIWGGEFLVGDASGYERAAHFEPVPLPGGDAAIRAPWRQAVSHLRHACGPDFFREHPDEFAFQADRPVEPVLEMLARGVNAPLTSSCGRLFDAVAAIVGPWTEATYEAQAAIELMALTDTAAVARCRPFAAAVAALEDLLAGGGSAPLALPVAPIVRAVREARRAGVPAADLSAMFHRTLIEMLARTTVTLARRRELRDVVLGGGVFQNGIVLAGVSRALADADLRVLRPRELPPGDGAVAVGQAVVAARTAGF